MNELIFQQLQNNDIQTGRAFRFIDDSVKWTRELLKNLETRYCIIPLSHPNDLLEYLKERPKEIFNKRDGKYQRNVVYIDCDERRTKKRWDNSARWKLLELCEEYKLVCIEDIQELKNYPQQQETKTLWELASYFPKVSLIHIGYVRQLNRDKEAAAQKKIRHEWVLLSHASAELLELCPPMFHNPEELEQLKLELTKNKLNKTEQLKYRNGYEEIITALISLSSTMKNQVEINKASRNQSESELNIKLPSGLQASALIKAMTLMRPLLSVVDQSLFRYATDKSDTLIVLLPQLKEEQLEQFTKELDELISQFTARS